MSVSEESSHPEAGARRVPKKFNPVPFDYHREVEVEIDTVTNLGDGLGRVDGWVVMVPHCLPGERVLARIWHNAANFSRGDLVRIVRPSPDRITPACPLFGECGGCQYQNLNYDAQLALKTRQIGELLAKIGGIRTEISPCRPSPRQWGYRSKITPHFKRPQSPDDPMPIGFLYANNAHKIIDVPHCPIATDAINAKLPAVRADARANRARYKNGATLLLRQTQEGVVTDHKKVVSEKVGDLTLRFLAGDFFQNNPFILEEFVGFGVNEAAAPGIKYLVDTYCGSGIFALSAARKFEKVLGIEVNADAVAKATENARLNGITNCAFVADSAEHIFSKAKFNPAETAVIIDPPRKGCDEVFLTQLVAFAPKRLVYVSCGPDTQARDLKFLVAAGYRIVKVQPFDLFPQTRHIENIAVLEKA